MTEENKKPEGQHLPINQETLDIIVANVIPTSKYFEVRFDHLENRVDRMQADIKGFRSDVDSRFINLNDQMDARFTAFRNDIDSRFANFKNDVDKRFEQVDKRFEQVDKRFEQMINSIDRLADNLNHRDKEHRSFTMRLFSISIMISFLGVLGVFLKLFQVI